MTNIDTAFSKSDNFYDFSKRYFNYLSEIQMNLDSNELNMFAEEFLKAREEQNTIFVIGNGGSASTATTMANDIGFDIIKKTGTDRPFRVFSLADNNSVITAISNDVGYEEIFINQLKIHYRPGDSLIVISASGNSPNVLKAAQWVKSKSGTVVGFLGFAGGQLIDLCDVKIHVKSETGEYGPVEDIHLIVDHIINNYILEYV